MLRVADNFPRHSANIPKLAKSGGSSPLNGRRSWCLRGGPGSFFLVLVHGPALDEDLGVPQGDQAAVLGLVHDPALDEDLGVPQGDQVAVLGLLFIAGLTLNLRLEVESKIKYYK